jgi:hypothetical protein
VSPQREAGAYEETTAQNLLSLKPTELEAKRRKDADQRKDALHRTKHKGGRVANAAANRA